jgi:hypothetical protein
MASIPPQPRERKEEEGSRLAQVTFRVRCDNVGHGEEVFLSDPAGSKVRRVGMFQFRTFFFCVRGNIMTFVGVFPRTRTLSLSLVVNYRCWSDPPLHDREILPMVCQYQSPFAERSHRSFY